MPSVFPVSAAKGPRPRRQPPSPPSRDAPQRLRLRNAPSPTSPRVSVPTPVPVSAKARKSPPLTPPSPHTPRPRTPLVPSTPKNPRPCPQRNSRYRRRRAHGPKTPVLAVAAPKSEAPRKSCVETPHKHRRNTRRQPPSARNTPSPAPVRGKKKKKKHRGTQHAANAMRTPPCLLMSRNASSTLSRAGLAERQVLWSHTQRQRAESAVDNTSQKRRSADGPQHPLSPVPHRRRSGCVGGAAGWVRACVGWVSGVSRACGGCVRACVWVCRGRVAGCVRGVSGCVGGPCLRVSSTRVVPRGPRPPPPPLGDRFCVCPRRGLCRTSSASFPRLAPPPLCPRASSGRCFACVCSFLFSASLAVVLRVSPGTRAAVPWELPLFPGESNRHRRASAFRRARRTSLLFAVAGLRDRRPHRTTPHHTQLFATSKFHPPAKNTPPPLGDPAHGPEWMSGVHLGGFSLGLPLPVECAVGWRVHFHGLPDCAPPRRRQQAPCTSLPIKARCVSAGAHGRLRRPRV